MTPVPSRSPSPATPPLAPPAPPAPPETSETHETVCVYMSSSDAVAPVYFAAARALGTALGRAGKTLVYGGGNIGLMGAVARATHHAGGRVVAVIPAFLHARGLAYADADELVLTPDMGARKATMIRRARAFVALPGGFGTLEEVLEVITLKQLHLHDHPVVFLDVAEYFAPLLAQFDRMRARHFAKPDSATLYHVTDSAADVLAYLATYRPTPRATKWY